MKLNVIFDQKVFMKYIVLYLLVFLSSLGFSQSRTKYILVPVNFAFSKMENPYNMSSLTKSYFQKNGFEVYLENELLPQDLAVNRCLAWRADLKESSAFLLTKITLELRDCYGQLVAVSQEGKSREKDRRIGYSNAFRDAVKSFVIPETTPHPAKTISSETTTQLVLDNSSQNQKNTANAMHAVVPTENKIENVSSAETKTVSGNSGEKSPLTTLYAQPIDEGFQLVDATPKVVLKLQKTSRDDVFIGVRGETNGVVYRMNSLWYFDYYQNNKLVSEVYIIKF